MQIIVQDDPAWENKAYAHIKFDHIFGLWSFITQFNNGTFGNSTAHNGKFNTIYKTCITYT